MQEIWKDIAGYDGKYQVSNFGNVRTNDFRGKGISRLLKLPVSSIGYKVVNLNGKTVLVHRLVAEAFIPNPEGLPCINHIDEIKDNNCADNLEWCDYSYNLNYNGHNACKKIMAVKEDGTVEHYESLKDASDALGITSSAISMALHKKKPKVSGRVWFFNG
jgi:hypothetical protein